MSARRDPRRKSFFDTPSSRASSNNDSPDGEGSAIPRRKKRIRRVSVGASTVFTTDDGFQYRRRQTLIHPKASGETVDDSKLEAAGKQEVINPRESGPGTTRSGKSPKNSKTAEQISAPEGHVTPESNSAFSKRLTHSTKFKKIPKKTIESSAINLSKDSYPEYPDTSEWLPPAIPSNDTSSSEVKLLNFLKHLVSFEICQASCVYLKEEYKFILDRIEAVCKAFLAKANEQVLKVMDEIGPLKNLKTLPNPANIALLEKEIMWNDVIAASLAELSSWNALKDRPLTSESNLQETPLDVAEYLKQQNLHQLLKEIEYHEPIMKGFLSISVKADNIYKTAQASSQVLSDAIKTQENMAKWVTQRSLKPMQKIVDPQAALLNVISSNI